MDASKNPIESASTPAVSAQTITIAGILVTIHGLTELPPSTTSVACLWLLHPRLQTQATMTPIATQVLRAWHARSSNPSPSTKGLIALSFDQRNHGTRLVDPLHNEAWRQGNPRHAPDMFSSFHGTATDTSHLISHLSSYILHTRSAPPITQHLCLGVSLGGHAAWHCVLSDPRISAAVVVIGCPDYTRLLTDRARFSKRDSYTESTPPGATFLGSQDFPQGLVDAVAQYDPAGLLLPGSFDPAAPEGLVPEPGKAKIDRMRVLIRERLHGKQILNLYGKSDKLVPYAAGEPFLKKFKEVLAEDPSLNVEFEDVGYKGVGHKFDSAMAEKATAWICGVLERDERTSTASKI
ncbi:hypothetical protein K491DRAFT_693960 [Lophiostoma macrostomum CBS 122681]|uniref:Alpha/beta-hydrolase n=1 Tax=Lophiostoma macrostomum CBS 122681 TaxID=1314788 RepID=A0A6A6T2S1_9PLEO|nr:hypothetical protein K491DRAFT_693960 [Lophiostoma macrostomum CBS 122681]